MADDAIREMYARVVKQIAEMDAACRSDIDRYEQECRDRTNDRWRRHGDETRDLHNMRLSLADAVADIQNRKPVKLVVSKEWCERMARLEGDAEIGAGVVARDPEIN